MGGIVRIRCFVHLSRVTPIFFDHRLIYWNFQKVEKWSCGGELIISWRRSFYTFRIPSESNALKGESPSLVSFDQYTKYVHTATEVTRPSRRPNLTYTNRLWFRFSFHSGTTLVPPSTPTRRHIYSPTTHWRGGPFRSGV